MTAKQSQAQPANSALFEYLESIFTAITFNDVRLRTRSAHGKPLPEQLNIQGRFSRNIPLKVPFASAAMDTVTEAEMAIAMAEHGGIGVIHAGLDVEEQYRQVRRVKLRTNAVIDRPIDVHYKTTLRELLRECQIRKFDFRTFPVKDDNDLFCGILTQTDIDMCQDLDASIKSIMIPKQKVVFQKGELSVEEAYKLMIKHKVRTLPLLHDDGRINKLYLFSDVKRIVEGSSTYNTDANGRLLVAAAVPSNVQGLERAALLSKYADAIVIDSADGDSSYAFETLKQIKQDHDIDVVVGNISDSQSALELAQAGADGIKVGQGPGSICTTRIETGIGMPQVTAVWDCVMALRKAGINVPVIADGGIRYRGDIPIIMSVGASSVMMGGMLAGTDESPGELLPNGRKKYRGMGSAEAFAKSASARARYGGFGDTEPLAEGIEAEIAYQGSVVKILTQCRQALEKSMRYTKCPDLETFFLESRLRLITNAGLNESQAHVTSR